MKVIVFFCFLIRRGFLGFLVRDKRVRIIGFLSFSLDYSEGVGEEEYRVV